MKKAILELLKSNIKSREDLAFVKRKLAKKYKLGILLNSDILKEYRRLIATGEIKANLVLEKILRKRSIRTMSGIAPVAVLTKPYPCPGNCAYCPSEKDVPASYLSNEPAVMRAIRCGYNPYKQVQLRLRALEANGHEPTKIELIVIGGTWSALPEKYKYQYITECFRGANDFSQKSKVPALPAGRKSQKFSSKLQITPASTSEAGRANYKLQLKKEQKKNEKAKYKIIGLTLETRPDYINEKELIQMRELGCTRVEIGVQAIDNKILKLNKRGHGVEATIEATKLLKNFGFKVTYHIMPNLPGSTAKKDLSMFKQLFTDERFQPDQIKFYPTIVTKGSLLYRWWQAGKYKPYSNKILQDLIVKCKKVIPTYVRVIRLIRDIPGESIIAGNKITNLRQVLQARGVKCNCIRCREARDRKFKLKDLQLVIRKYKASGGQEYFISYESKNKKTLYGFCRLRLSESQAIIRELHVYGELVPIGGQTKVQHAGLGKKLMIEAEKIAKQNNYKTIAVISGIGVRNYYYQLGYKLKNTYMIKIF